MHDRANAGMVGSEHVDSGGELEMPPRSATSAQDARKGTDVSVDKGMRPGARTGAINRSEVAAGVGERLRAARVKAGLTQVQLCVLAGIGDPGTISRAELGHVLLSRVTVLKIVGVLEPRIGTTEADIWGEV